MNELVWLQDNDDFPAPDEALDEPNGLLAVGADLSVERLVRAYRLGIFPWYSEGQPPLWWSPDPRAVLLPGKLHLSRSMRKELKRAPYSLTTDRDFAGVIQACATERSEGTWIIPEMIQAYTRLHLAGFAHSVEVWHGEELVAGLYGVQVGALFCGESMFHRRTNASKYALIQTAQRLFAAGFHGIDCQVENPHLASLGVEPIRRQGFLEMLQAARNKDLAWPSFDNGGNGLSS